MTDRDKGRQILSTAFVRVGPGAMLTVERRDGTSLVLRNVTINAADYCGTTVPGGAKYCGGFAEVIGAAPGGGTAPVAPDPITEQRAPSSGN